MSVGLEFRGGLEEGGRTLTEHMVRGVLHPPRHSAPALQVVGECPLLYTSGTWGSETRSLSMTPAGQGPIQAWRRALLTFGPGRTSSSVLREHVCTHTGALAHICAHTIWRVCGVHCSRTVASLSFTVLFCDGLSQGSARPRVRPCGGVRSEQGA